MPLDDRLRRGFDDLTREVDPDVENRLEDTTRSARARPRPAARLIAFGAVIVLAVVLTSVGLRFVSDFPPAGSSASPSPTSSATCPPIHAIPGRTSGGICGLPLQPGAHRATWFTPPFEYVIPANGPVAWDNVQDMPGQFAHPDGTPGYDGIFLFRDVAALEQQCTILRDPTVRTSASELADWMEANDGLIVSNRVTASIGGLNGIALDLASSGAYTTVCPNITREPAGMPHVPLIQDGSGFALWFIWGTERMRLYLLDLPGGGNVVVAVDAIDTDFAALLELCEPVIQTIQFDPDYY
jgi:hypothetical protein